MAAASFWALRAVGSQAASSRAIGFQRSSRRCSSAAACARSAAMAAASGPAVVSMCWASASRSAAGARPARQWLSAWMAAWRRGRRRWPSRGRRAAVTGSARALLRAASAASCACVASRAASRRRSASFAWCSCHSPSRAAFRPQTGQSPSPCASWKRRAWSRRAARSFDFAASVPAAARTRSWASRSSRTTAATASGAGVCRLASCRRIWRSPSALAPVAGLVEGGLDRGQAPVLLLDRRDEGACAVVVHLAQPAQDRPRASRPPPCAPFRGPCGRRPGSPAPASALRGRGWRRARRRASTGPRRAWSRARCRTGWAGRSARAGSSPGRPRPCAACRGSARRSRRPRGRRRPSSARRRSSACRLRRRTRPRWPPSCGAGCASPASRPWRGAPSGRCRR